MSRSRSPSPRRSRSPSPRRSRSPRSDRGRSRRHRSRSPRGRSRGRDDLDEDSGSRGRSRTPRKRRGRDEDGGSRGRSRSRHRSQIGRDTSYRDDRGTYGGGGARGGTVKRSKLRRDSRSPSPAQRTTRDRTDFQREFNWEDFDYKSYSESESWNDDQAFFRDQGLDPGLLDIDRDTAITAIAAIDDEGTRNVLLHRWNRYNASFAGDRGAFNRIEISAYELNGQIRRQNTARERRIEDVQYDATPATDTAGVFEINATSTNHEHVGRVRWTEDVAGGMEITGVSTELRWRNRGNAQNLIQRTIDYARSRGINQIRLQADAQSTGPDAQARLVRLYGRFGFTFDGQGSGNWMTLNLLN